VEVTSVKCYRPSSQPPVIYDGKGKGPKAKGPKLPKKPAAPKPPLAWLAEARRLYLDEGLTLTDVGKRMGVGHTTVHRAFKRAGVPTRSQNARRRLTPAQEDDVVLMRSRGRLLKDIAATFKVSMDTIRQIVMRTPAAAADASPADGAGPDAGQVGAE
jgi:hypothetical protein